MDSNGRAHKILAVYFWLIVLFLLLPIFVVIPMSLTAGDLLRFPPEDWGLRWYREFFASHSWVQATWLSVKIAVIASLLATATGTLTVIALDRRDLPLRSALLHFVSSPLIIPHVFLAVGVFVLAVKLRLTNNEYIVAGAHAAVTLPFIVLIVGSALKGVDRNIERAARVLGAGPVRAFRTATLPSLIPSMLAGATLSFFISFDELIISQFLLSSQETLPMKIWADVRLELKPTVAAVSSLLIIVSAVAIIGAEMLRRRMGPPSSKSTV
ncbi:MAG TPA: ABC transporter permease [Alcaligenes sp.]|nr:ABC transporter permease [Alcaligenes sp.]HRL27837.1 ABC transporter permease [Alcaligenes sp.]